MLKKARRERHASYAELIAHIESVNEALVENGMARIYGTRTALYDERDSRAYLARLHALEDRAKAAHKGAWRFTP